MCAALAKVIRSDFGTHCKAFISAVQRINNRKRTFHYLEPSIYQQHVCKRLLPREAECKNEGIHRKLFNRLLNYKFHYKKSGETWQHSPAFFSLLDQSIRVFLRNRNQYNIKWSISRNQHNGNVNLKNQKRMSRFFHISKFKLWSVKRSKSLHEWLVSHKDSFFGIKSSKKWPFTSDAIFAL